MNTYKHETHLISNPLLPFIFHRDTVERIPHGNVPHWHENIELLFCVQGSGRIQCGPSFYTFEQGDLFTVNSNQPHSFASDTKLVYYCLIIDSTFCESNGIAMDGLQFRQKIRDEEISLAFRQVIEAFEQSTSEDICSVIDIRYAALGVLRLLCRNHLVLNPQIVPSVSDERVKKVIAYIRNNMTRHISLDDLSSYVGISKYHLAREFKTFTGRTVIDTVNLIRCTEARKRIENGMNVSSAAISCGFDNLTYFSRTFKKHFGELPSSFLRK